MKNYPLILENNQNTLIIALSDTEIGKVALPSSLVMIDATTGKKVNFLNKQPSFKKEMDTLKYANTINELMPKFIRQAFWKMENGKKRAMLVMERLTPLPIHHFDLRTREIMMKIFELQIKQLHDNQFVHGDFMRPTNYYTRNNKEWMFQNIIQTETGLRLIDSGFSKIRNENNAKYFFDMKYQEQQEIKSFKAYYLSDSVNH